ncbi:MAG: hypothetical protein QOG42_56 [Solirubrobacteraceae bacterium]|nr:hypothetical protein [Solirubrobacteraceae bacterium]
MSPEPPESPRRLSADTIGSALGGDAIPEGYVRFLGYLHAGDSGTHRIVVDEQFLRWLVVDSDDIAGRMDPPPGAMDSREQIWVRRGARMTKCEVGYAPDIANQGWGVETDPVDDADIVLDSANLPDAGAESATPFLRSSSPGAGADDDGGGAPVPRPPRRPSGPIRFRRWPPPPY